MKNKFYCDIQGTFDGGIDRKYAIPLFVQLLEELTKDTELSFSFISSCEPEYVKEFIFELEPYLKDTNITLGDQFCSNKVITKNTVRDCINGKSLQMYYDINKNNYQKVFYADDSKSLIFMASKILETKCPNLDFSTFEANGGIDSLNSLINDYNKNNTMTL